MSNFQSKLGDGLSKIQGGVEQSKAKLQTAQEVSRLRKTLREQSEQKSRHLLELGQLAHLWIREGRIQDPDAVETIAKVKELDVVIFNTMKRINALNEQEAGPQACQCGAPLTEADKFCGACGTRVNVEIKVQEEEPVECLSCGEQVPASAHYCGCCGTKMAG